MTFQITIGKFGDDDTADIKVDGRVVGWLERVKGERFKSVTSRARVSFVSHYTIVLTDDLAFDQLRKHDVDSRAEAKLEVACAFEQAWTQLIKNPGLTAWNGKCPLGRHGLDYRGQVCDLCPVVKDK